MKDVKDILKKLPESWDEISLGMFQKLTSILITETGDEFDGIENSLKVIEKLTDIPVAELEDLPLRDIQLLGNRVSFMTSIPKEGKASITQWKKPEEITYNNYVNFIQIPADKQLESLHIFVKNFSKTDLTEEEILQLPILDILHGFFFAQNQLILSVKHSIRLVRLKMFQVKIQAKVQGLKRRIRSSRKASIKQ